MIHRTLSILIGLAVIVGLRILGEYIFNLLALPDLCDYHNKDVKTSWLFDLFLPQTSANGCHPGPGLFFYLFVISIGVGVGMLCYRTFKRNTST
jgi:hypothetical protein